MYLLLTIEAQNATENGLGDQFLYLFRSTVLEWNAEARVQNGDRRRRYRPKLQIVYWRKNQLSILMNVSV